MSDKLVDRRDLDFILFEQLGLESLLVLRVGRELLSKPISLFLGKIQGISVFSGLVLTEATYV